MQTSLIRRSRSHFLNFEWGVEVILGVNGFLWIGKPRKSPDQQDLDSIYSSTLEDVDSVLREAICRTRNCILAMNNSFVHLEEPTIKQVYSLSLDYAVADIISEEFYEVLRKNI